MVAENSKRRAKTRKYSSDKKRRASRRRRDVYLLVRDVVHCVVRAEGISEHLQSNESVLVIRLFFNWNLIYRFQCFSKFHD